MSRSILLATVASTAMLASIAAAAAQSASSPPVEDITVTAEALSAARNGIQTQLGASTYTVTANDIQAEPGGDNSLLNSVILQMPDVAQDSYGQFHVRGEHNQLQYRINGIILPEGISVFGQTLDPRLAESVKLIDGALPAEYGLDTGGIVDIQTKTGMFDTGGHVSMYGGSHNTLTPSFDYGGSGGTSIISFAATTTPIRWASRRPMPPTRPTMTAPSSGTASPSCRTFSKVQQPHRHPGHLQRHVRDSRHAGASAVGHGRWWGWGRWIPAAAAITCCRPMARPSFPARMWTNASARSPITQP